MFTEAFVNGDAGSENRPRMPIARNLEIVSLGFKFNTEADRDAFAAHFPKYCKARVTHIGGMDWETKKPTRTPYVSFGMQVNKSNGVTGDLNEAALKRHNKIFDILESLNLTE